MFSRLEFFIALRYLRSKSKEKFISITAIFSFIGITLGVATLIIVMSVMNGFREDFTNRILGINSHISVFPFERGLPNYEDVMKIIEKNSNVRNVSPIIENQVMIIADNGTGGVIIKGIKKEDLIKKDKIYDSISSPDFDRKYTNNAILLGQALALKLNVVDGDYVKVVSPEANATVFGVIPRIKTYKVAGTFSSGMYEYDSGLAFIPLDLAQKHFKYTESVGALEIYLNDIDSIEKTYTDLSNDLKAHGFDVNLVDWKKSNAAFIGALNVERNVMFIILTLIILVATFNIISSLTMLVNDKNKQIALLRAIGFTKKSITRIFLICGMLIGITGTFVGTAIGILFSKNIKNIKNWLENTFNLDLFSPTVYFLTDLPSKIVFSDVLYIILLSLFLSFLSTIYPSYKASKTNPAEVLRYE